VKRTKVLSSSQFLSVFHGLQKKISDFAESYRGSSLSFDIFGMHRWLSKANKYSEEAVEIQNDWVPAEQRHQTRSVLLKLLALQVLGTVEWNYWRKLSGNGKMRIQELHFYPQAKLSQTNAWIRRSSLPSVNLYLVLQRKPRTDQDQKPTSTLHFSFARVSSLLKFYERRWQTFADPRWLFHWTIGTIQTSSTSRWLTDLIQTLFSHTEKPLILKVVSKLRQELTSSGGIQSKTLQVEFEQQQTHHKNPQMLKF
jgi:hypothetical protein